MNPIHATHLLIRPFQEDDVNGFHAYRSDETLAKFQSYAPYSLEQATDFIRQMQDKTFGIRGEWIQLAIEDLESKLVIGDIGLKPETYDERVVEFGITVSGSVQGRGIGKEALSAVLNTLFTEKNIHRVIGYVDMENTASIRLLKSVGFREEGRLRKSFCNKGVWRDEYLFAILEEDWK